MVTEHQPEKAESGPECPVDRLREAARLMRERAEAARPSPWNIDGPWWHDDDELGGYDATDMVTSGEERRPVAVTAPRDLNDNHDRSADMRHIASWHPAVALAVAHWLAECARLWEYGDVGPLIWQQANAVADAYLGTEATHVI